MAEPLKITPDQVSALMARLPVEAREPGSGFEYDEGHGLSVPDQYVSAVQAIIAVTGWDARPASVPVDPAAKLAALQAQLDALRAQLGAAAA